MVLRGVRFGDYHTASDWGFILNEKTIEPPEPKIVTVSVDGRDGDLDLSETLTGEIKFNNRKASFTFLVTEGTYYDREYMIKTVYRVIHGRKLKIILDDDTLSYLYGRCAITSVSNNHAYGVITIEADCEPYRYAVYETIRTITLTDTATDILLSNGGVKSLIPTLQVSDSATIQFGTSSLTLGAGEHKILDLVLKTGETLISVKGTGTLTVTYREGAL